MNQFGFRLLQGYLDSSGSFPQNTANTILSPLSMSSSLGMVINGASGQTKESIANTLGVPAQEGGLFNETMQRTTATLTNQPGFQLAVANSLWVKKGVSLKSAFRSVCQDYYAAQSTSLDFSSPDSLPAINGWVNQATQGNIPKILEKISPSTVLYLINAVYFKGRWANQFDPQRTKPGVFHLLGGGESQSTFMNQSGRFSYVQTEDFKGARLPYRDERLSMIVCLPTQKTSIEESVTAFQATLNSNKWAEWQDMFHTVEGTLSMPRFEIDCDMNLKETLIGLGMKEAFDQSRADFSEMCDSPSQIFISDVKHKTRLEVNEEGTVASAATKVTMTSKSIGMRFSLLLDRPFFIAIQDNHSGALLFIGWITQPTSSLSK